MENQERQAPVRRRPRRRRRSKFQRFIHRYFALILTCIMCITCVGAVGFTVHSISGILANQQTQNSSTSSTVDQSREQILAQINALIKKADGLAAGYDYRGAIELLQGFEGYEEHTQLTERIAYYEAEDDKLMPYSDVDSITHLFFHSLIADPARAFDGDDEQTGFNLYMVTIKEFKAILEEMYARGYVLVSPYDIAYEVVDENGARFEYGNIRLPEGKIPFLLSQDDVNYYGYMIGTGNGKNETPVFADSNGDGFASRIVIDENGHPTCEYIDEFGNTHYGEYDIVPVLEAFIQEHPDFSYHGARGILGVTGYEGVFGYRTKPSYKEALGEERYNAEVQAAKEVAQCLKDHGWIIASHSYGHPSYGNIEAPRVEADSTKWEDTVQPIVGNTDVLLFPYGADIAYIEHYTMENEKFAKLYEDGYRYFFNVDSKISWTQIGDNYYRGARRNIDGYRMFHHPDKLSDLFDVSKVFDSARPTPVPNLSGGM